MSMVISYQDHNKRIGYAVRLYVSAPITTKLNFELIDDA